jgi:hypothetical protein
MRKYLHSISAIQIKTPKMVVRLFLVDTMKTIILAKSLGFQCDDEDIGKSVLIALLLVKKPLS